MMKRLTLLHVVVGLVLATFILPGDVAGRLYSIDSQPEPYIIDGLVTVQLEDNISPSLVSGAKGATAFGLAGLDQVLAENGVEAIRKLFPWRQTRPAVNSGLRDLSRFYELRFPVETDVQVVIDQLLRHPDIRHAEPVWAVPVAAIYPNDPGSGSQWYLSVTSMFNAWEIETGSDSIKIAIIDTGVDYRHPDLEDNIWVNPGEDMDGDMVVYDIDDLNGVDDDGNGVVDDLVGYDFFSGLGGGVYPGEDGYMPDDDPMDFDGHGTHCSGISAAASNNAVGVCGMAGGWASFQPAQREGARIMCLRAGATGADGYGYVNINNCATAIDYATLMGAHVINCSWGGSSVLSGVVANALAAEITIVHAAGNDNADAPDYLDFAYGGLPISVAATRSDDRKAWFSNYGTWVDVSAPGDNIYSTIPTRYSTDYAMYDGTSMSAPMVAGLVALVRSMMPSLTRAEVDDIVINTADNIDAVNPSYVGLLGSGRINSYAALQNLANAKFTADIYQGNVPLTVNFTDQSPNSPSTWQWTFGDGDGSDQQHPSHTYTEPGIRSVSLIIDEPNGVGEEHLKNFIWVQADTMVVDSVGGYRGDQIVVPVYLNHTSVMKEMTFSFTLENDVGISFVDLSLEGLRTEDYFKEQLVGSGGLRKAYTLKPITTGSTTYLPPGDGPFLNLILQIAEDAQIGGVVDIDTLDWIGGTPNAETVWGDYWPVFSPGKVVVLDCCGRYTGGYTGNTNCSDDGLLSLSDISRLIDHLFVSKLPLCCEGSGNVNGSVDGLITLSDVTRLIDNLYISKEATAPCQ